MVVINTKKILITILVSALLLVGSALTVFAFEFSAPQLNGDLPVYYFYKFECFDMYNKVSLDEYDDTFEYVGTFRRFYNDSDNSLYVNQFSLTLSQYGFDYLSQNGSNINSIHNYLEDFIEGSVGNISCVYYYGDLISTPTIFEDMQSQLLDYYSNSPDLFKIDNDLNNQFFNYESQYNNLLSQYQQLLQDYQNLQITISDLQTAINTLVSDNSSLNSQLAELQNQYNSLETQYNDLLTRYNDLVSFYSEELTRLLNENNELRTFLLNADTQINNLEYEINRLRQANAEEYMRGYTQAMEDNDLFAEGLYSIFSAPFTLVAEIAEIEIFGTSIVKIVGIVLLFVVLSIVLGFLWKILPLV